jgi:hypothetical protein
MQLMMNQDQAFAHTVMKLRVTQNAVNFMSSSATTSFSRGNMLVGEHMQLPDVNIHHLRTKTKPTNQKTKERPLARLAIPELKTKIKCALYKYNVSCISKARACCN